MLKLFKHKYLIPKTRAKTRLIRSVQDKIVMLGAS